ncbi:alpha/beta fold hydrolase [Nannocystaceae bacterium ST9]
MLSRALPLLRQAPLRPSAMLLFGASLVLELVSACNVVRLGERQLERKLERKGLRSDRIQLGDANMLYWEGGNAEGRPVVLLHGFGASAIWQWHEQIGPLAKHHRVIVPDLLWFGGSWSKRRDYTIDHQIETVLALLDHLGVEQADFVGISYGGILAHEIAALHPDRVNKLAILDSPGRVYTEADYAGMLARFEVADVGQLMIPETPEQVQVLLELGYHKPPKPPRWVQNQVLDVMYSRFRGEKEQLLGTMLATLDALDERPGKVDHETLLIWGREDRVFPVEIGERLAAQLGARAKLRIIDRAGHAPNLEHPRVVADMLVEFLR